MICDTVLVTIEHTEHGILEIVVPAYTVSEGELEARIEKLWQHYLAGASEHGIPLSMGDFALYCLAAAADDPRFIPEDDNGNGSNTSNGY